jgi:FAD/FMN-containing dehydrogenase
MEGIATVDAGARLGNVYTELWKQGQFNFNAGTCPTVGIGGHISGGGYGMSARLRGLAADKVISMRVVLYDGKVLEEVSAKRNKDLFWALRQVSVMYVVI